MHGETQSMFVYTLDVVGVRDVTIFRSIFHASALFKQCTEQTSPRSVRRGTHIRASPLCFRSSVRSLSRRRTVTRSQSKIQDPGSEFRYDTGARPVRGPRSGFAPAATTCQACRWQVPGTRGSRLTRL